MSKLIKIVLFITMLMCQSSFAALHLELTQGVDSAVPIAVIMFGAQGDPAQRFAMNLHQVMRQDFTNTGRFRPIDTSDLQQPHSAEAVNLKYWRGQGVNDVIVGQVTPATRGRFNVKFALVDVYKVNHTKGINPLVAARTPILAEQRFGNVPASQVRALAHHIDDILYLQLTGIRGIFSTKIAYVLVTTNDDGHKRYALEISDYDGHNAKAVLSSPEPIMSPAWAPDARHIAYVSFESRLAAIYETDVLTGKRRLISEFPGVNGAPAFSPDGEKLALVLTKTNYLKLYSMDLRSKKLTRLTNGYSIDTEPSWSPSGRNLLFTSDRAGGPQIYELHMHSRGIERLTFDGDYNARAHYTSDGKNIVLLHRDTGGPYSIAIMNLDTGILRMLVQGYDVQSPSVAPNGTMIIYSNRENGKGVLAEVSTDGKVQLRLPAREGDVREPAWSPYWDR